MYRTADRNSLLPGSRFRVIMARASARMTDKETAPPRSNAVLTAAAIGTLTAVAVRNRIRMGRPLPEMAFGRSPSGS